MAKRGKYEEWLEEDNLILIEGWARKGLTEKQIAHNMGISVRTLSNWKNKYIAINSSLKKGKEVTDFKVENALYKRALGYEYEETETYFEEVEGKQKKRVKKIKKQALPDVTAMIYWLKNRQPDDWRKTAPDYKNKMEAETERLNLESKILQHEADKLEQSGEVNDLLRSLIEVESEEMSEYDEN